MTDARLEAYLSDTRRYDELLDSADKWRGVPYSHFARQYRKFLERQVSAVGCFLAI